MLWLIIGIGELIILLAIIVWLGKYIKKRSVDYYTLFIIGIILLLFGFFIETIILWLPGLIVMTLAIAHRSEWKKNRLHWSDLTEEEKRFKRRVAIVLFIVFVVCYVVSKGII